MEISSLEDLDSSGIFKLTTDIDASDFTDTIDEFTGMIDGNGHTIYNLDSVLIEQLSEQGIVKNLSFKDCSISSATREIGIFGLNIGVIKNVTVQSLHITADVNAIGGIAAINNGKIQDCSVDGTIRTTGMNVGLIAGKTESEHGEISNCSVTGKVCGSSVVGGIAGQASTVDNCTVNCTVLGSYSIGGVVGELNAGKVMNTTVAGTIEADQRVGGVVGRLESDTQIINCTITTDLKGETSVGGVCGSNYAQLHLQNTHCDGTIVGIERIGGLVGKSISDTSIKQSSFTGTMYGQKQVHPVVIIPSQSEEERMPVQHVYVNSEVHSIDTSETETDVEYKSSFANIQWKDSAGEKKSVSISTESQLRNCSVFDEITLVEDITLEDSTTIFPVLFGSINGQGNTISNIQESLFSLVSDTGIVQDLTVTGEVDHKDNLNYGLISEYNSGELLNITIKNTHIRSDAIYTGSGVGMNRGLMKDCTVFNTTIHSKYGNTGGVVGKVSKKIENCNINNCKVVGEETVGGLTGVIYGVLKNCTVKDSQIEGVNKVGGIVGQSNTFSETKRASSIRNTVSGVFKVGGFAGEVQGDVEFTNSNADVSGDEKVGGFAGHLMESDIYSCTSRDGNVIGKVEVGGFAGEAINSTIQDSFTTNIIKSEQQTGGFIGMCHFSTLENCFSSTAIQSIDPSALVYEVSKLDDDDIKNCYWDITKSGIQSSEIGNGVHNLPVAELKTIVLVN